MTPDNSRSLANAARHTVLRRVAPALKHDMVVQLQAVSMMAEMLNARIERGTVTPTDLQANISKLNRLSREAVMACLKVTSWIEAPGDEGVPLHQGVEECVNLLTSSFNFRGFSLVSEVAPTDFEVCRHAVRNLVTAALLHTADAATGPCEIYVAGEPDDGRALLAVRCRPRRHPTLAEIPPSDAGARAPLDWNEMLALARTEGVELARGRDGIELALPRAVVTSPLQMAPV